MLGRYRVLGRLGAGGMGEVYHARDDSLGRDVAIKVLPASFSADPGRLSRFEQEARATARLNHPNIVAVFDVGQHAEFPYLVCELLEGQTLHSRLTAGPLSERTALQYAVSIAHGLAAAHDKGIVHRDLKPENLFITRDGRIKILDFGIAKLTGDAASANGEQPTRYATSPGVFVGTVGYAAPEQVRDQAVDARADLFSLGAILYEMVTGRRAFRGTTSVDTAISILKDDPLEDMVHRPPPALERIIRHCLEKNPEARFQCARDLAFDLASALEPGAAPVSAPKPEAVYWRWVPLASAILLVIMAALFWVLTPGGRVAPQFRRLTYQRGTVYAARFSPDQKGVVYSAAWEADPIQIFSSTLDLPGGRPFDLSSAHLLAVSKSGELALSLRGRVTTHLVFMNGTLARTPMSGGAPRELLDDVRWADWSPSGELAVVHHVQGRSRLEYPINKVLYETSGWISHIRFSPAGDRIAFLDHPAWSDDRGTVAVVDPSGHKTSLGSEWESEDGLAWSPDGTQIWFTAAHSGYSRALFAVDLSGHQRLVLRVPGGLTLQDISPDGRVLVSFDDERYGINGAAPGGQEQDLSWFDSSLVRDISPDGKWLLLEETGEPAGPHYAVAMRRLDGSPPIKLGEGSAGAFSPDGKWVAAIFTGKPEQVVLLPTGAGQSRTVVVPGIDHFQNAAVRFLPDGKHLVLSGSEPGHAIRSYVQDLEGGKPRPITPEGLTAIRVSPDGKRVVGVGANREIVVYSLNGGPPRQVPGVPAGFAPGEWTADSSSLLMDAEEGRDRLGIYRVNVETGKRELLRTLSPKDPAGLVFVGRIVVSPDARSYAYSYYRMNSVLYVISGLK
jgi:Tol biopolymer transport system component